jgi:Protein of unknown function (DUF2975)
MSTLSAASPSPPLRRLGRLSRAMEIVTTLGILLVTVLTVLTLLIPDWTRNLLVAKLGYVGAALPVTPVARAAAAVAIAPPVGVMLWGLLAARALFREFASGRVFTESAARQLQKFAAAILVQAPLGPLTSAGLSVAISLTNETGERMHAITFSLHDYHALIIGGVLFAAASVMREAARLAAENASFV